jgi:hypothetical protein
MLFVYGKISENGRKKKWVFCAINSRKENLHTKTAREHILQWRDEDTRQCMIVELL